MEWFLFYITLADGSIIKHRTIILGVFRCLDDDDGKYTQILGTFAGAVLALVSAAAAVYFAALLISHL